jgi:hypothetical protein
LNWRTESGRTGCVWNPLYINFSFLSMATVTWAIPFRCYIFKWYKTYKYSEWNVGLFHSLETCFEGTPVFHSLSI